MASDHELDLEFRAESSKSIRPTSTLARSFADQLNDIFLLDDQLDQLDSSINRKKQSVSYQNSELQLLEARIKHAEKLLEESKRRLSGRSPDSSNRTNVPDYETNPAFSSTASPKADADAEGMNGKIEEQDEEELKGANGAAAKEEPKKVNRHAHKMSEVYQTDVEKQEF